MSVLGLGKIPRGCLGLFSPAQEWTLSLSTSGSGHPAVTVRGHEGGGELGRGQGLGSGGRRAHGSDRGTYIFQRLST